MSVFTLETTKIAIGDPVMGLACYSVSLAPGTYALELGALTRVPHPSPESNQLPLINLDGPCLYVLDASRSDQFRMAFHAIGNECSYMMLEMQNRHAEIERITGIRIGYYWEEEIAGANREGTYVLDASKIHRIQ